MFTTAKDTLKEPKYRSLVVVDQRLMLELICSSESLGQCLLLISEVLSQVLWIGTLVGTVS